MLYLKNDPSGIDRPISDLQERLFKLLCKKWNIGEKDYNSFCRAYKNQKAQGGYIPEFYMGGNEYRELFFDDAVSVTSFFVAGERVSFVMDMYHSDVSLIFNVDISKLKNSPNRADEEVRLDVVKLCKNTTDFDLVSIETGIANVFREFSAEGVKYRDMHPLHCFRLNFKIIYSNC
jgi:hypothetical protein